MITRLPLRRSSFALGGHVHRLTASSIVRRTNSRFASQCHRWSVPTTR